MNIIWRLAAYVAASVIPASANAAIVSIKFSGVMQSNSPQYVGEKFSGVFSYDPDQVLHNYNLGTPKNPVYPYIGDSLTTTPFGTTIGNMEFVKPTCLNGRCLYNIYLFNWDNTLDVIKFLVPETLDIKKSLGGISFQFTSYSSFTSPNGLGGATTVGAVQLFGTGVFSMQAPAVPEPSTWAMMLGGFGLIGAAVRYRRRKPVVAYA